MAPKKIYAVIGIVAITMVSVGGYMLLCGDSGGNDDTHDWISAYDEFMTENSGSATVSSVDTKLLVFGNANNDVRLGSEDMEFIQSIVDGKTTWDKDANPLADANADGKITEDDVKLLQKFLNGEDASMFYLNSYLETTRVKFPLDGKIVIGGTNDADILKIIGRADRIVAGMDGTIGASGYANSSKWVNVGTYPYDYEKIVASGATITMGQPYVYDATFENRVRAGYSSFPIDMVKLCEARYINGVDGIACTVTMGALMNSYGFGTYEAYLNYVSNINAIVEKATANLGNGDEKSYILLTSHSCNSPADLGIDTKSSSVENYGDIATVENLRMTNAYPIGPEGYITGLSVEDVLKHSPDVIFVEAVVDDDTPYSDFVAVVEKIAGWCRSAGFAGRIIGTTFSVMGNAASISMLPLLSSYVYGEGVYSSDDAWEDLVTYYNTFLGGNYTVEEMKKSIYGPIIVQ